MIVVIGGGTMGAGIAAGLLAVGQSVRLIDVEAALLTAAHARIESSLLRLAKRDPDLNVGDALERLTLATGHEHTECSLVVEAVRAGVVCRQPEQKVGLSAGTSVRRGCRHDRDRSIR